MTEVKCPGWFDFRIILAYGRTIRKFGDFSLGNKGQPSEIHSQNTLGFGGCGGASKSERRGTLGTRKGNFFSNQIALSQSPIGVEIRVVAKAILVTSGGEGEIRNSWFANRMVTGEDRERRGKRRIKGRRGGFVVALDP